MGARGVVLECFEIRCWEQTNAHTYTDTHIAPYNVLFWRHEPALGAFIPLLNSVSTKTNAEVFVIGQRFSSHTELCLHSTLSLAHCPSLNPPPPPSPPPYSNAPSTSYVDAWVGWGRSTKASTQHSDSTAMARRRSSVKNILLTVCCVWGVWSVGEGRHAVGEMMMRGRMAWGGKKDRDWS